MHVQIGRGTPPKIHLDKCSHPLQDWWSAASNLCRQFSLLSLLSLASLLRLLPDLRDLCFSHIHCTSTMSDRAAFISRKFRRFRILVIGRANAGKTTLLQRVCKTTESPIVRDQEGNKVRSVVDIPSFTNRSFQIDAEVKGNLGASFAFCQRALLLMPWYSVVNMTSSIRLRSQAIPVLSFTIPVASKPVVRMN